MQISDDLLRIIFEVDDGTMQIFMASSWYGART